MAEETASEGRPGGAAGAPGREPATGDVWARETAPQSSYTMRQVGVGLMVFVVVAAVAFGLPLALA